MSITEPRLDEGGAVTAPVGGRAYIFFLRQYVQLVELNQPQAPAYLFKSFLALPPSFTLSFFTCKWNAAAFHRWACSGDRSATRSLPRLYHCPKDDRSARLAFLCLSR